MKLVASNEYNNYSRDIKISFDKDPVDNKSLAWYIILLIVLGCLLIVGLVVFLVIKYKRKQTSKDSLLSASKQ